MSHGITRGWYTVFRFFLSFYCLVHFVALLPYGKELFSNAGILPDKHLSPLFSLFPTLFMLSDAAPVVTFVLVVAIVASFTLMIGYLEGWSALVLWCTLTELYDRNPLIQNPSLPYLGWLLLAVAVVSFYNQKKDRWVFPKRLYLAAWVVMALGYTYSGYTKLVSPSWIDGSALQSVLENPLARDQVIVNVLLTFPRFLCGITWLTLAGELFFAPLALFQKFRPWVWLFMAGMHFSLLFLLRFADLSCAMLLFHLFTFDPGWIKPCKQHVPILCFYDGECGLCHRFVQWVVEESISNGTIRFAPLQGALFASIYPGKAPDSIAVYESETKKMLFFSEAVFAVLVRLGGISTLCALFSKILPLSFQDALYSLMARNRTIFFKKPSTFCPLIDRGWFA